MNWGCWFPLFPPFPDTWVDLGLHGFDTLLVISTSIQGDRGTLWRCTRVCFRPPVTKRHTVGISVQQVIHTFLNLLLSILPSLARCIELQYAALLVRRLEPSNVSFTRIISPRIDWSVNDLILISHQDLQVQCSALLMN